MIILKMATWMEEYWCPKGLLHLLNGKQRWAIAGQMNDERYWHKLTQTSIFWTKDGHNWTPDKSAYQNRFMFRLYLLSRYGSVHMTNAAVCMVLTATGRSGKAWKNCLDMEKDGNLIKNTKNREGRGWKRENSGCAHLSQYFLWKTTTMTMPEVHWQQNPNIKQYAAGDWSIWSWPASLQPIVFFLSKYFFAYVRYCKFQLRTWTI